MEILDRIFDSIPEDNKHTKRMTTKQEMTDGLLPVCTILMKQTEWNHLDSPVQNHPFHDFYSSQLEKINELSVLTESLARVRDRHYIAQFEGVDVPMLVFSAREFVVQYKSFCDTRNAFKPEELLQMLKDLSSRYAFMRKHVEDFYNQHIS